MLDSMRYIPWEDLSHALGNAREVPHWLMSLTEDGVDTRDQALEELYDALVDQKQQPVTPYVIPILYEMVQMEAIEGKEQLLRLLLFIALGGVDDCLEKGQPTKTSDNDQDEYHWLVVDCYEAAREGLPLLRHLVQHSDDSTGQMAAYLLAFFPEQAEGSIAVLLKRLYQTEDPLYLVDLLLSLEFLAHQAASDYDLSDLVAYRFHEYPLVSVAATLATASNRLAPKDAKLIVQALLHHREWTAEHAFFNDGQILLYLKWWLQRRYLGDSALVIEQLTRAFPQAKEWAIFRLSWILVPLLKIHIERRGIPFRLGEHPHLMPNERLALKAMLHKDGWVLDGNLFSPYRDLFAQYHLPTTRRAWAQYLRQLP